jgi:hypothetical protein
MKAFFSALTSVLMPANAKAAERPNFDSRDAAFLLPLIAVLLD